jgi:hypothetical protein
MISPDAAERLVREYVNGWREGDRPRILATLDPGVVIVESHGPSYRGVRTVARWIDEWLAAGATVDRWEITSMIIAGDACAFEWRFACTVGRDHWEFDGASIVRFTDDMIVGIREYRMTEPPREAHGYELPGGGDEGVRP